MPVLVLLVALLLVLNILLIVGTVVYAVHRRPLWNGPITAGITTLAALAAVIALVFNAGGSR
ncbi:hypothetical protein ACFCYC_41240 [Streptomyces sp. NPDC056402]|uniref:hypothetical protein n=1 Tax=Streptomyces sp. NPDC056402 TaxID=3345810 RepID=UPI0035DC5F2F